MAKAQAQTAKPMNVARAISQALDFHRNGQLPQAAQLIRDILAFKPDHFDALHMLGVDPSCSAASWARPCG